MRYVDGRQEPAVRARVARYAHQGVDVMRNLTVNELAWVAGGTGGEATVKVETPVGGVEVKSDTKELGDALIETYEGIVQFVSHVIERVAESLP